jgi:hypothetical protein
VDHTIKKKKKPRKNIAQTETAKNIRRKLEYGRSIRCRSVTHACPLTDMVQVNHREVIIMRQSQIGKEKTESLAELTYGGSIRCRSVTHGYPGMSIVQVNHREVIIISYNQLTSTEKMHRREIRCTGEASDAEASLMSSPYRAWLR